MFHEQPLLVIDTDEGVRALAERLSRHPVVAVDTESDSMYHYQEKVCLLQFTDAEGDVVLDTLAVSDLEPLGRVLADPGITKVFHGADYDIVCLKRDFGFELRGLYDTLVAAQFCGLERLGLADLIGSFFGTPVDKTLQRHDWSQRPLLQDHLDYARGDTHYLPALREILTRRLVRVGRLDHHLEECALLERKEWQGRSFDPEGWQRVKGLRQLDEDGLAVLRRLWLFRDAQARILDRPTYKVLGDDLLLEIAAKRPEDRNALERLFPRQAALRRRYGAGLIEAVREGLQDEPPTLAPVGARDEDDDAGDELPVVRVRGRSADRVQEALKNWRNHLCQGSRMHSPFTVASNHDLKRIARVRPVDLDELATIPGIRRWQVRDHGQAILRVLDEVAPPDALDADAGPSEGGGARRRRRGGRRGGRG